MILRRSCCLWSWWVSWGQRRRQQNPVSEARLLPLCLMGFIGSLAEAAKSCFSGVVAAFDQSELHRVNGRGSKILLPRRGCCLCALRVSSSLRRRQQNPASKAHLLPLRLASFIGSMAEAAKTCFSGVVAAFALGEFHWVLGGGSKFLILRRSCCLCAWWFSRTRWRRQQNLASEAWLLLLVLVSFIGASAVAADIKLYEEHCCLWDKFIL